MGPEKLLFLIKDSTQIEINEKKNYIVHLVYPNNSFIHLLKKG